MRSKIEDNRLVIEADEGKMLTDGAKLFAREYAFPEGVEKNEILHEITEAEYEAIRKEAEEKARAEMRMLHIG